MTQLIEAKRRGRPPKLPPAQKSALELFDRVKPLLTPDLREYLEDTLNGDGELDAVNEMQLLLKQLSVYVNSVIGWAQEDGVISKDVAAIIAEFRMAIRDHEEMRRKRIELDHKYDTNNKRVVDPTSKSTLARFEGIPR